MDQKNDIDLRGAIPETPEMCRQAVLQAVSTYREERSMRKPYKVVVMAAVIVMLMCSTAFAIVHYYSVRDYMANGTPSEAFDSAVLPLEKSVTSNGLTFTLGDAVFDGRDLAFAMSMAVGEDASPLYVYPTLKGFCGERELDISYNGFDMAHTWGFFLPNVNPDYELAADQGVTASLYRDTATGEVTWRYSLALYRPTGELVDIRDWDTQGETYEEYEDYLRALHAEGKIGCWRGTDMLDWLDAISTYTGYVEGRTFADRIEESGLFELEDVISFEFTTAVPQNTDLTETTEFDFDGYTVTVKSITQTFMRVDYVLEVVYDEPQPHEHDLEQFYALTDQNGNEMAWRDSLLERGDDMVTVVVTGSVTRISDEPLTAITFTLDHNMTIDQNDTAGDMPSFTVEMQ